MRIFKTRLERYPVDNPIGWVVGFTIQLENGRVFYAETLLKFEDLNAQGLDVNVLTDEELFNLGYERLRDYITEKANILSSSSIIGGEFIPPQN
jgi:hypothetical protein